MEYNLNYVCKKNMAVKYTWNKIKKFSLKFINKTLDDNVFNLAAALAYYTMFSIVPMLYIIINSLGILFNKDEISKAIFNVLSDLVGTEGANTLQETLTNLVVTESGWFKNLIGVVILIFTATTIFSTIQKGLNFIFRVKPNPEVGILKFFKTRLLAFSIIIGISFSLVVSLVLNALITLATNYFLVSFSELEFMVKLLNNYIIPFFISSLFFTVIFKFLPDAKITWRDAIIGAAFTGFLFTLGKYAISIYIGNSNIASLYDAAGSIMILFVWLYYTSLIFYIGAVFTVVYTEEIGSGVIPKKDTLRFKQKEVKIEVENEKVIDN